MKKGRNETLYTVLNYVYGTKKLSGNDNLGSHEEVFERSEGIFFLSFSRH